MKLEICSAAEKHADQGQMTFTENGEFIKICIRMQSIKKLSAHSVASDEN